MVHDPICESYSYLKPSVCYCEIITEVRNDERNRINAQYMAEFDRVSNGGTE